MNEPLETKAFSPDDILGLTDEQARQPEDEEQATRLRLTVQEQATSFEQAMAYVFQKNSELYGRLA